jgi:hypothetical protein
VLPQKSGLALVAILVGLFVSPPANGKEAGPNLIPNPEFRWSQREPGLPEGWHRDDRKIAGVEPSHVYLLRVAGQPGKFLAIAGGPDRNGRVWRRIKNIRPHTDYLLEFLAYRPKFTNGYLEVEIFGQRHLINQHLTWGSVQPIFLTVNSQDFRGTTRLSIENPRRGVLAFGSPSLTRVEPESESEDPLDFVRLPNFFPVGIFAAKPEDLADIRAAGFNAVQSYDSQPDTIRKMAAASEKLGLKFLPNFRSYRADISRGLGGNSELLGFYIEDEPETRSVPPEKIRALKESLKRDHPGVLTAVAMLRPQMVEAYRDAADIFMLDPYPVPNMPLTWLADTFEEASRYVPRERLWAVIQAFGGGDEQVKYGWSRLPTCLEMRCLTYLALVHGAQGVFYFSYPDVHGDAKAWEGLKGIVGELRQLRTWLNIPNEACGLRLEMTSPFRADAAGRAAVHFCQKHRESDFLLILVNVIDRPVSFFLTGFPNKTILLTECFGRETAVIRDNNFRGELGPYEVRVYNFHQEN